MSTPALRSDLVQSAVNFLKDPKIQSSTLQKRVAFLESKGLTSEEISEALRQANGGPPATTTSNSQLTASTGQVLIAQPPPVSRMDWRDYFIAAFLIGGIGYAVVALVNRYLGPLLRTPTANELERDKQALSDQFTTASERLDLVKADTNDVRKHLEEQSSNVKASLEALDTALKDIKQQELKRDADFKSLKEEIDSIRDLIPKILEKSKDTQNQSFLEVQQELKSLKSLILNRRTTSVSSLNEITSPVTNSPVPTSPSSGWPSIPAWQLSMNNTSIATKAPAEQNITASSEQNSSNTPAATNGVQQSIEPQD